MSEKSGAESHEQHDLERMVRSFSRADVENFRVPTLEQNIILPQVFYQATVQFTLEERENRGVMLANEMESDGKKFYVVEYMQTLGYGDDVSVFPDDQKKRAFMQMLQEHGAGMKVIEYHAHTIGTGQHWQNRFSGGDFDTIRKMLTRNPDYIHILFTPTNILTLSEKAAAFKLARVNQEARAAALDKFERWQNIFSSFLA